MDEIVDTLRSEARFRPTIWGDSRPLLIAAAAEIERLDRAAAQCADEIARLRKALDTIAQVTIDPVAARRAREALT